MDLSVKTKRCSYLLDNAWSAYYTAEGKMSEIGVSFIQSLLEDVGRIKISDPPYKDVGIFRVVYKKEGELKEAYMRNLFLDENGVPMVRFAGGDVWRLTMVVYLNGCYAWNIIMRALMPYIEHCKEE